MFYIKNRITKRSKYLKPPFAENKHVQLCPKPKQMPFVANGGKFKLYTVLNGNFSKAYSGQEDFI
jgi:hypothetical protein